MKFIVRLLLAFLLLCGTFTVNAQPIHDYHAVTIPNTVVGIVPMLTSSATPNLFLAPVTGLAEDDAFTALISIGFPFTFNGNIYNNVWVSSNGHVNFDENAKVGNEYGALLNWPLTIIPSNEHYIALYQSNLISTLCLSLTTGTSPNRVFTVDIQAIDNLAAAQNVDLLPFILELRLFEANNKIEIGYTPSAIPVSVNMQGHVAGLRGGFGQDNFVSIDLTRLGGTTTIPVQSNVVMYNPTTGNVPDTGLTFIIKTNSDIQAVAINVPTVSQTIKYGEPITPCATFRNVGWVDETNIPVCFHIIDTAGGAHKVIYSDCKTIPGTLVGHLTNESASICFKPWTPPDTLHYVFEAISVLPTDTSFKNDTAKRGGFVTPVTLASISARIIGRSAHITWSTSLEENLFEFSVERLQGHEWITVGEVPAKNFPSTYSFTDASTKTGINFYRLRMTDKNGGTTVSPVVSASVGGAKVALGQNYPNPFNPSTMIPYDVAQAGQVRITVMDMLGRNIAIAIDNNDHPVGSFVVSFDASAMPTGSYFYRISSGGSSVTKMMVITK